MKIPSFIHLFIQQVFIKNHCVLGFAPDSLCPQSLQSIDFLVIKLIDLELTVRSFGRFVEYNVFEWTMVIFFFLCRYLMNCKNNYLFTFDLINFNPGGLL